MPDDRAQDVTPAEPGTVIGHYQVLGELGRGGMGVLYRARDLKLDREVALKRPYPSLVPDLAQRQRFEREARAAAQLAHPHIVPIFEVLEQDGVPWLAMELVHGRSLRSLLELGEPLPLSEVLRHAEAMAGALSAAHARGILHRDVNPKNIMVTTDGRALLTDFGLARVTRDRNPDSDSTETQENEVTRAGAVLGTPGYMSPEQALGRPVDPRSDLFCLGAVLYEMCTRERAFSASGSGNVLDAVLHHDPPPITRVRTDAPPELDRIVRKLLSKEAEERYQDAADVVADVRSLRRQVEWERFGSGRSQPAAEPARPRRRQRVVATAVAIVGVLAAWFVLRPGRVDQFNPRDWLLIGAFENDTGNRVFDETLREGLVAVLNQSTFVNVFPDDRLVEALQRMRKPPGTPVDVLVGRELCEREGIRVLLTGSIRQSGPVHSVRALVRNARTGSVLVSESEQFESPRELFGAVDALAARVRDRLGESLPSIEGSRVPLEQATTSSLEALRLYSAARQASRAEDQRSAITLLLQAIEADAEFGLAYGRLGEAYVVTGEFDRAREAHARAAGLTEGVTPRERFLIAAADHGAREDYEAAAADLRALVALHPDDASAHHRLAIAYDAAGRSSDAIAEMRQCLRIDPNDARSHANLALLLATASREDEALKTCDDAKSLGLESPYLGWARGLTLLTRGDASGARQVFARLAEGGPSFEALARFYAPRIDVLEGRWSRAAEQLARDCLFYRERGNQGFEIASRNLRARLLWLRQDADGARRELDLVLREPDGVVRAGELRAAGTLLAQMGRAPDARRVLVRLEQLSNPGPRGFWRACVEGLRGEIALAAGRPGEAEQAFSAAAAAYPHPSSAMGMARVQQSRKDWPRAADSWAKVIEARGDIVRSGVPSDWVLAHLERGRALRMSGRTDAARGEYERFARLWQDAEPSPLLEQAQRELRALAAPPKQP